jgi:hypothetical protein
MQQRIAFMSLQNIIYDIAAGPHATTLFDILELKTADVMPGNVLSKLSLFNLLDSSGKFTNKNVSGAIEALEDLQVAHPGAISNDKMEQFKKYQQQYC